MKTEIRLGLIAITLLFSVQPEAAVIAYDGFEVGVSADTTYGIYAINGIFREEPNKIVTGRDGAYDISNVFTNN